MMSQLSIVSLILGAATLAVSAPLAMFPTIARKSCAAFPRSTVMAWILTAVDLAWSAALLYGSPMLSGYQWAQRLVVILAPVAFILAVFLLDELLAARALGGLLVLIPRPVLDAAFVHDSDWRLVMTLVAYVMVVAGIVLILSPFRFRQASQFLLKTDNRSRLTGALGLMAGMAMVIMAVAVY